ncbi:hypothetical protein [Ralstonia pseudosolanacearum]|uniref:T6SS immunity protein Tli3 family protein n=1 Tax=Ralstonia pseudosolanacearum TaxID=1310165 RepID=UPI0020A51E8F|nr:hypothetical protein [Ralstonia pseudosolanacearum]
MLKVESLTEVTLKRGHFPVMQNPRIAMLVGATAALLLLAACGLSPADRAAASVGFGDTISEKTLNNIARPPKQVVYRFDDHRYIENDPEPGFNLPCQDNLFYVDEQLGVRTQIDGNKKGNPKGLFKVVNSPYVVAGMTWLSMFPLTRDERSNRFDHRSVAAATLLSSETTSMPEAEAREGHVVHLANGREQDGSS